MAEKKSSLFEATTGRGGEVFKPTSLPQFAKWAARERDRWMWLHGVGEAEFPSSIRDHIMNQLNAIVAYAESIAARGSLDGDDPPQTLRGHYEGMPPQLIHSTSDIGRAIFALRDTQGDEVAAVAAGIYIGQLGVSWVNPLHARAVLLVANPSLMGREATRAASQSDYKRWSDEAQALLVRHDGLFEEHQDQLAALSARSDQLAVRSFWKIGRRSAKLRQSLAKRSGASIVEIDNVRKAYEEDMQLRASVQYWETKKNLHSAGRADALKYLRWFSGIAGLAAILLFWAAISFMLEASGVNVWDWMLIQPHKDRPIALATYVIVTAAVGTALTAVFWAARVLVRNYLTERRLELDAEERRIMTQTYLALIKEGAASNEDRLVILNALFRPSPDQPTGDDGGNDIALPAIIAKLMDQRLKP
ncbi:DUF6161 domain-containing protein [Sphingopyxis sp. MWB1]|uniref:DUF6161 domain-containing protein n=1 Tax=Sphingopyxis sp. MWB1 TaxID=1537715 RepID=UPI000B2CFECE|nr:DUF6161 domain-containing protein [Sphingopyxis sp. MWB1]